MASNPGGIAGNPLPSSGSTSASASAKHTTLPISRTSGAAYERPERARTSHACEPCRERKTKCDGERPSCRRCLHTGTGCHYGYGKGWRKRKTAEDLTATSRRLARYEALLNDIIPMVPPNVKSMIEEAREHNVATSTTGSETTESGEPAPFASGLHSEPSSSSSTGRASLPLPLPHSLAAQPSRVPVARSFGSMSPTSTNNPLPRPTSQQRGSPDDPVSTRLPSIRPDGLLIEAPAGMHHPVEDAILTGDRIGMGSTSPTGGMSHGGWSPTIHGQIPADSRKRPFTAAFSSGMNEQLATLG